MNLNRDNLRFNVLRNALYHTARRRVFERINRILNFAIIALGATAMSDIIIRSDISPIWLGATVTIIGALQLVFDFARQARDHQILQRDYYHLLAEIEEKTEANEADCARWQAKIIRITSDEPPILRALDAKAYNDALDALDIYESSERLRIPLLHQWLGSLFSFEGHTYRKFNEIERTV